MVHQCPSIIITNKIVVSAWYQLNQWTHDNTWISKEQQRWRDYNQHEPGCLLSYPCSKCVFRVGISIRLTSNQQTWIDLTLEDIPAMEKDLLEITTKHWEAGCLDIIQINQWLLLVSPQLVWAKLSQSHVPQLSLCLTTQVPIIINVDQWWLELTNVDQWWPMMIAVD